MLRDRETGKLANAFVLVANIEATDGGAAIVAGNERVVRARLSDAKFFFETDKATPLAARLPKLETIVFHDKLGTVAERVARVAALAEALAPLVGADPALAKRAAELSKADLVTEMVGEFPELQGADGAHLRGAPGRGPGRRRGARGALQAARAVGSHADRAGLGGRCPRRQARFACRVLGGGREADGLARPVRVEAGGAGGWCGSCWRMGCGSRSTRFCGCTSGRCGMPVLT